MWPNSKFPVDFDTFTEEILNRKFHFCARDYDYYYLLSSRKKVFWMPAKLWDICAANKTKGTEKSIKRRKN